MKVSEYKRVMESLARFASTRVKAVGPESRVGVQISDAGFKLIVGSDTAGLIYTVDPADFRAESGKYGYTIDARPLLESAKVLPTKDEVFINVTKKSLTITASGGGKLTLNAVAPLNEAGFPKKPKQSVATASVHGEQWGQMSRLITDVAAKIERPTLHYIPSDVIHITVVAPGMRAKYANLTLPAIGGTEDYSVVTELDFWDGIKAMTTEGKLSFGGDGVLASSGNIECFSTIIISEEEFFWPVLGYEAHNNTSFKVARSEIISALRAQAPADEHNRVTFTVGDGRILVTAYGNEEGLTIPVETHGKGIRSVNAGYLRSLLTTMTDTKSVTISFGSPAPAFKVDAPEYDKWLLLVAPVSMR